MKKVKKAISILLSVILWGVILLAALFAFTTLATRDTSNVANFMGYTPMIVQSESMSPVFHAKDLIIVKKCDPAKLEVNDIVTFHAIIMNEYALNTHRIVEINNSNGVRSYVTKGDNNQVSDQHIISDGDIVGKYVGRVPRVGAVLELLSSTVGFLLIIVLPMLIFFIYQVYHLIMVSMKLKRAVAEEDAKAALEKSSESNDMLAQAEKARAEAEAALAEAKRLKEEAAAQLAAAQISSDGAAETASDAAPEAVSEASSETASETAPEDAPEADETAPEAATEAVSEDAPKE